MALILSENINEILLDNFNTQIVTILAKPLIPNSIDLVDLIVLKNEKQKLGKEGNRLVVLEIIFNKIIFLKTTLIKKAYKFVIFIYSS